MKLTKILLGNKLTKTHKNSQKLTSKLTLYLAAIRRQIAEISNYIRYLFFICEFVSLQYILTCEEKVVALIYCTRVGDGKLTKLSNSLRRRGWSDIPW